jgi:hypothetical protein
VAGSVVLALVALFVGLTIARRVLGAPL